MENWKTHKLNPIWKRYNDHFNEGAEGYNPHDKYQQTTENKKQIFNRQMTVFEARDMLSKLESSLPKHTDENKIKGCKDCIDILKTHLEQVL
jgi:hypothetical protein